MTDMNDHILGDLPDDAAPQCLQMDCIYWDVNFCTNDVCDFQVRDYDL